MKKFVKLSEVQKSCGKVNDLSDAEKGKTNGGQSVGMIIATYMISLPTLIIKKLLSR